MSQARPQGALRRLIGSSVLYVAGDLIARALLFALVPVWTHYLAPERYGIYEVLRVAGMLLTSVAALALGAAVTRRSVEEDGEGFRRFYGTVVVFQVGLLVALLLLFERFGGLAFEAAFQDIPYLPFGRLTMLAALLSAAQQAPMQMLLFRERPRLVVTLSLATFGIKAATSVALVVGAKIGVLGLFYADLATAAIMTPAFVVLILKESRPTFVPGHLKEALAYSLPLVPHTIAHLLLTSADRYVLEASHGARAVGLYGAAYLFSSALTVLCMGSNKAMVPFLFKACARIDALHASEDAAAAGEARTERSQLTRAVTLFLGVVVLGALGADLASPEVVRAFMADSYQPALPLLPWVIWGAAVHGTYLVAVNVLFYYRRTTLVPWISGAAAALNIGLNLLLIPRWGALAAAITTLVAYIALAVGTYWAASRCMRLPVDRRAALTLLGLALGGAAAAAGLDASLGPMLRVGAKTLVLVGATAVLLGQMGLDAAGLRALVRQLLKARGRKAPQGAGAPGDDGEPEASQPADGE